MISFFNAQFNHCSCTWMLHIYYINNRITSLRKRCLRLAYCKKNLFYKDMLEKHVSVSIHYRNILNLTMVLYKSKKEFTTNVFCTTHENHYNLCNLNDFKVPFARTVYHGTETISYLWPKIWDTVPTELKQVQFLNSIKKSFRK